MGTCRTTIQARAQRNETKMALSNALGQLFRVSGQNVRVAGSKQVAALSSAVSKYELPDLSYDYGALEPHVSGQIMELHHDKHHRTYVNNLNAALEQYEAAEKAGNLDKMIELQNAIKFNGGGHLNHSIFWQNLSPNGGGEPTGELSERINTQWGSFEVRFDSDHSIFFDCVSRTHSFI